MSDVLEAVCHRHVDVPAWVVMALAKAASINDAACRHTPLPGAAPSDDGSDDSDDSDGNVDNGSGAAFASTAAATASAADSGDDGSAVPAAVLQACRTQLDAGQPKAALHALCKALGWESPLYDTFSSIGGGPWKSVCYLPRSDESYPSSPSCARKKEAEASAAAKAADDLIAGLSSGALPSSGPLRSSPSFPPPPPAAAAAPAAPSRLQSSSAASRAGSEQLARAERLLEAGDYGQAEDWFFMAVVAADAAGDGQGTDRGRTGAGGRSVGVGGVLQPAAAVGHARHAVRVRANPTGDTPTHLPYHCRCTARGSQSVYKRGCVFESSSRLMSFARRLCSSSPARWTSFWCPPSRLGAQGRTGRTRRLRGWGLTGSCACSNTARERGGTRGGGGMLDEYQLSTLGRRTAATTLSPTWAPPGSSQSGLPPTPKSI